MTLTLSVKDIENVCYEYAKTHFSKYEPIPPFEKRYPGKLESALEIAFKEINGKPIYKSLFEKAGALFYEMNKLHPFLNGNKRIAFVTLMFFLFLNGKFIKTESLDLYKLSITIANSVPEKRKQIINKLTNFIRENTIDFDFNEFWKEAFRTEKSNNNKKQTT